MWYGLTREELVERQARLLADARMTREEVKERAEAGLLSGEEYQLWEEIRGVEFLLGNGSSERHAAAG